MAKYTRLIYDGQWKPLEPLQPKPDASLKGGLPPVDNRQVLESILWVLCTGAR